MKEIASRLMAVAVMMAMVGGAGTLISLMTIQQADAAAHNFCYISSGVGGKVCTANKGDCQRLQRADRNASSGCFKQDLE